jgi:GMP synthase, PP-ATPase domain/subunit
MGLPKKFVPPPPFPGPGWANPAEGKIILEKVLFLPKRDSGFFWSNFKKTGWMKEKLGSLFRPLFPGKYFWGIGGLPQKQIINLGPKNRWTSLGGERLRNIIPFFSQISLGETLSARFVKQS